MKFHELKTATKSGKGKGRVGRGISAGQGKTAGRGTKGYGSRTGSTRKPGFEGGQNPLMQRLPKLRGFASKRVVPEIVSLSALARVKGAVTNQSLFEAGLVSTPHGLVKIIGNGEVTGKHVVTVQFATKSAAAAIEKAGGSFTATAQVPRVSKKAAEK